MPNTIFYFSATGNSFVVARDLADRLGDTKLVSIVTAIKDSCVDLPCDRIGFVFPVHFMSVPPFIKRFVAKLEFTESQYIFSVLTCGGMYGTAFTHFAKYIEDRGGLLRAGFAIQMPGNNINLYSAWPDVIQHLLIKRAKKKTAKIAGTIAATSSNRIPKGNVLSRLFKAPVDRMRDYDKFAKDYHVTASCIGCGVCEEMCPVKNISMVDKQPRWGDACERCTACIQWCPTRAIEYADKTRNRRQYRHPAANRSDLLS